MIDVIATHNCCHAKCKQIVSYYVLEYNITTRLEGMNCDSYKWQVNKTSAMA